MAQPAGKTDSLCLDGASLDAAFASGATSPTAVARALLGRGGGDEAAGVWTYRVADSDVLDAIAELERRRAGGAVLPLFGWPFVVKDNIDVAGMPTTAACPAFSYVARRSAAVVERLLEAGAVLLGKTNLDQFATGLVGTRSPYGIPRNPFDPQTIPGGSSSGSAVAVARELCTFALGTDTAGSGRVPAALNGIVGLKPSRGLLSTQGVVPACRSLDCVSIFARGCADAWRVFQVACAFQADDPFSRPAGDTIDQQPFAPGFRFGVPATLELFGDVLGEAGFARAVAHLRALGGHPVSIDLAPFRAAARLLYEGPWVAERLQAAGSVLASNPDALDPAVREILLGARRFGASEVFDAQAELALIDRQTQTVWDTVDVLVTPTVPTTYSIAQVQADPLRLNANLGYYTNFVNLLDLCAVAVPAGFRGDGLPFGISLVGRRGQDARLVELAARFHAFSDASAQASRQQALIQAMTIARPGEAAGDSVELAVVGAHLSGEPLNHELTELGATLVETTRTASCYRLFELPHTRPAKPGLLRSEGDAGAAIEVEVWRMACSAFGRFVARIKSPLCIGSLELEGGRHVHGFLCESHAVAHARDISSFGGWRAYRKLQRGTPTQ